ncbi:hypothetical protein H4219_005256 [Mycoemilia scoparia]|uniref:Cytochrome b561 domain-containing protein n=1 Tax=Mycoemilia scoparia TaxID=417184 RepID=A0A9W8DQE8_9FUNG|nr:hypothetical protein H4219_005256 [Mycoemilia scoparia]
MFLKPTSTITNLVVVTALISTLLNNVKLVKAHDHHAANFNINPKEPIDGILKTHIVFMSLAYGLIFPVGLVLGLVKNRWHVLVQSVGTAFSIVGFVLGHMHKGRMFKEGVHSKMAWAMLWLLVAQVVVGIYLRLRLSRFFRDPLRPYLRFAHKWLGVGHFLMSYAQILTGALTWLDFCRGGYLGQCLAHFIMGSSFVGYGVYLLLILKLAGPWLHKFGRSPEFYDSCVIMAWGCFNTFTEHGFVEKANGWSHKDLQHTSMGILWWIGGGFSVFMLRKSGPEVRSMFPAMILAFTGLAMAAHEQSSEFSTKTHFLFGTSLILTGITRCLELLLVSTNTIKEDKKEINPFQYLPVFFLMLSGFLFMGANAQQLELLDNMGIDVGTYGMAIVSLTFLGFLYAVLMMTLYQELDPFGGDAEYESVTNALDSAPVAGNHFDLPPTATPPPNRFSIGGRSSGGEGSSRGNSGGRRSLYEHRPSEDLELAYMKPANHSD